MPLDRDNPFYAYKASTQTVSTPAELQRTVAKLGRGETLTPAEKEAIGTAPTPDV